MWLILQQDEPDDYILASGEAHSVREFVERAFGHIGVTLEWRGTGVEERGVDANTGRVLVQIDERYVRPTEVDDLCGDATKAKLKLGWEAEVGFEELVKEMMESDLVAMMPGRKDA